MDTFTLMLGMGFTVYYLTAVLLYNDDPQPWQDYAKKVTLHGKIDLEKETVEQIQHYVGLFDRIRRMFGLYIITETEWVVNKRNLWMWTCPKCLSAWVSSFLAILIMLLTFNILPIAMILPAAGISYVLFSAFASD